MFDYGGLRYASIVININMLNHLNKAKALITVDQTPQLKGINTYSQKMINCQIGVVFSDVFVVFILMFIMGEIAVNFIELIMIKMVFFMHGLYQ